jgi:hypothetical protein
VSAKLSAKRIISSLPFLKLQGHERSSRGINKGKQIAKNNVIKWKSAEPNKTERCVYRVSAGLRVWCRA